MHEVADDDADEQHRDCSQAAFVPWLTGATVMVSAADPSTAPGRAERSGEDDERGGSVRQGSQVVTAGDAVRRHRTSI